MAASELTAGFALGAYGRVERRMRSEDFCGTSACQLAQWDVYETPCHAHLEAFHYVSRQRIRHTLGAPGMALSKALIEVAEWDDRNGSVACQLHHRRYDAHLMPPLLLPAEAIPGHVWEFVHDWGLEAQLEARMLFGATA